MRINQTILYYKVATLTKWRETLLYTSRRSNVVVLYGVLRSQVGVRDARYAQWGKNTGFGECDMYTGGFIANLSWLAPTLRKT